MKCHSPLVTAHSGCEDTPENSLESLMAGIAAGADTVEIDVRATRDGTPILMHDQFVRRNGTDITAEQLDLDELSAICADANPESPAGRAIITLEQALDLVGSRTIMVNLDLKDDGCIDGVVALVRKHGHSERVILTGCTPVRAKILRAVAPELPVLLNAEAPAEPFTAKTYMQFVENTCRSAIQYHCCGINVAFNSCRRELVIHGRRRYLPVSVWTIDDTRTMKKMIEMGVHSITTHHPRRLAGLLKRGSGDADFEPRP